MLKELQPLLNKAVRLSMSLQPVNDGSGNVRMILSVTPIKTSLKDKDSEIKNYSPRILTGTPEEIEREMTSERIMSLVRERANHILSVDAEVVSKKAAKGSEPTSKEKEEPAVPKKRGRPAAAVKEQSNEDKQLHAAVCSIRNLVTGGKRNEAHADTKSIVAKVKGWRAEGKSLDEKLITDLTALIEEVKKMPAEQIKADL